MIRQYLRHWKQRLLSEHISIHPVSGVVKNYFHAFCRQFMQIRYLKENYPRMSAAAIYRQLQDNGSIKSGEISESTINRYVNQPAVKLRTTTTPDMRRYERPHINKVWCGDSSAGPCLKTDDGKKYRLYIIALIDDASRFIVGIDVFLMATL